jgi:hypothetical protein
LTAQIENVPFPPAYLHIRINIVEPGVKPDKDNPGINPFSSSLHAISVNEVHVPVYTAMTPSVKVPALVLIFKRPLEGTTTLYQTSLFKVKSVE